MPAGHEMALNLHAALLDLRDTQNSLTRVSITAMALRIQLYRDLGIMILDEQGRRVETPIPASDAD
jgi:hypothetical protein